LRTRRKRSNAGESHPTREKLIISALELLRDRAPDSVQSEEVLVLSGVSRGSLYHHFEDLSDLIETALVRQFAVQVDDNLTFLTALLDCATAAEFHAAFRDRMALSQSAGRLPFRSIRTKVIGQSFSNPRLAAKLAEEQTRLTDGMVAVMEEAQRRGWANPHIDPRASVVLMQAYTLGRVIDDIAVTRMDEHAWQEINRMIIDRIFIDTAK
jgi:AcrR family transcriptional regulator